MQTTCNYALCITCQAARATTQNAELKNVEHGRSSARGQRTSLSKGIAATPFKTAVTPYGSSNGGGCSGNNGKLLVPDDTQEPTANG